MSDAIPLNQRSDDRPPELHAAQRIADDLTPVIYDELRRIARAYFRNLRPGFTLCPTELVNEACLHLLQHGRTNWTGPEHFRAVATRKIWQVIVDHLRHRMAAKRGGVPQANPSTIGGGPPTAELTSTEGGQREWQRQPLDAIAIEWQDLSVDLLDLADALDGLGAQSERLREVVMLHWFGGLKYAEVARVLGISASSVEKDFRFALAWLNRKLLGNAGG